MRTTKIRIVSFRLAAAALVSTFMLMIPWGHPALAEGGFMDLDWSHHHDGAAAGTDMAVDMAAGPDGSIYVTGPSDDALTDPCYLTLKYRPDGSQAWANTFAGEGGDTPQAIAVDPVSGAAAVTGYSWVAQPEGHQILTILYEPDGSTRWERYFGGLGDGNNSGYDVAVDGSGNVVVGGVSYRNDSDYDFVTVKYSPQGDLEWSEYYDGPPGFYDQIFALVIDGEGRIYVTGRSAGGSGQGQDFCTVCYSPEGTELWVARYAGPAMGDDVPKAIALHPQGGVVVGGTSPGSGVAGTDVAVVRYDGDGNELWVKRYDSPDGGDDACLDLAVAGDGTSFAVGSCAPSSGGTDLLVFQVAPDGGSSMALRRNGPGSGDDCAAAVVADGRGSVLVAGTEENDAAGGWNNLLVLKLDCHGTLLWAESYDGPDGGRDEARSVAALPGGGVAAAGFSHGGKSGNDFLTVALIPPSCLLFTAPGPGPGNPARVRCFHPEDTGQSISEFAVYGVDDFGANTAAGDLDGDGDAELLTGPGPGAVFGPQVRAFESCGVPMAGGAVNFFAYGTLKFGVNVTAGDLDGDGTDEIVTGAGPGAVFGPHVRGFGYAAGAGVQPLPGVSFFAYGTPRYGVNVAAGDLDGDGTDEIVTGAGPGAVFGPHVRAFAWDGAASVSPVAGVSFFAYGTLKFGVNVAVGDIDGDGIDEILTGAGPGEIFGAHVRAYDYDGGPAVVPVPGVSFFAFETSRYGVRVSAGDLNRDGTDEILVVPGPDPSFGCLVRAFRLKGGVVVPVEEVDFFAFDPSEVLHGGTIAGAGPSVE